jgi:hypothetical protein
MTLEQAISNLTLYRTLPPDPRDKELLEAIKLGIEAMKRLQDNRRDPEFDHWVPLPGETEE